MVKNCSTPSLKQKSRFEKNNFCSLFQAIYLRAPALMGAPHLNSLLILPRRGEKEREGGKGKSHLFWLSSWTSFCSKFLQTSSKMKNLKVLYSVQHALSHDLQLIVITAIWQTPLGSLSIWTRIPDTVGYVSTKRIRSRILLILEYVYDFAQRWQHLSLSLSFSGSKTFLQIHTVQHKNKNYS